MPVELLDAVEAVGEPYYLGRNGLFDLLKPNARLNVIPYKNSVFFLSIENVLRLHYKNHEQKQFF